MLVGGAAFHVDDAAVGFGAGLAHLEDFAFRIDRVALEDGSVVGDSLVLQVRDGLA